MFLLKCKKVINNTSIKGLESGILYHRYQKINWNKFCKKSQNKILEVIITVS